MHLSMSSPPRRGGGGGNPREILMDSNIYGIHVSGKYRTDDMSMNNIYNNVFD